VTPVSPMDLWWRLLDVFQSQYRGGG
jgi:hypothetical protein